MAEEQSNAERYAAQLAARGNATGASPLLQLLEAATETKTVPWPGRAGKPPPEGSGIMVAMRLLPSTETEAAIKATADYFRKVVKWDDALIAMERGSRAWDNHEKAEVLLRALRQADQPELALFEDVVSLKMRVTDDVREALFTEYLAYVDELSPLRRASSDKEVMELVESLTGKAEIAEATLSFFDSVTLRRTVQELAFRLYELQRRNSSDSWSANSDSSDSTPSSDATINSSSPSESTSSGPSPQRGGEGGSG